MIPLVGSPLKKEVGPRASAISAMGPQPLLGWSMCPCSTYFKDRMEELLAELLCMADLSEEPSEKELKLGKLFTKPKAQNGLVLGPLVPI